jgi:hypothetical protein
MSDHVHHAPNVKLVIRVLDGTNDVSNIEIWTRDGLTGEEFVTLLRQVADKFETGEVRRVQ